MQGVIIPPPEIRAVVDKTAQFVAKHGKDFEQKIVQKATTGEGSASKFNFMQHHDPYNAYYEFKIREFEENGGVAKPKPEKPKEPEKPAAAATAAATVSAEATATGAGAAAAGGIVRKQKMSVLAKALTSKAEGKPAPYDFSLVHPLGVSALDVEVIKLTAQHTAVSGRPFLEGLAHREQRNPQFDFLKPTHLLFAYFTSLVDGYNKVLKPSPAQRAAVEAGTDRSKVLDRCVHRWQYERAETARRERERAEGDKMTQLYQVFEQGAPPLGSPPTPPAHALFLCARPIFILSRRVDSSAPPVFSSS